MADLEELIERVESGTGADRELDLAVLNASSSPPYRWSHVHAIIGGPNDIAVRELPSDWEPDFAAFVMDRDDASPVLVPRYTTSLDAVLALIEAKLPGARWLAVGYAGAKPDEAAVSPVEDGPRFDAKASSPARALLAATLRALKETQHDR